MASGKGRKGGDETLNTSMVLRIAKVMLSSRVLVALGLYSEALDPALTAPASTFSPCYADNKTVVPSRYLAAQGLDGLYAHND